MKWLLTFQRIDKQRLALGLLLVLLAMSGWIVYTQLTSYHVFLSIQKADTQNTQQLKLIETDLQQISILSNEQRLSAATLKKISERLDQVQATLLKLPAQKDLQPLQATLSHIEQQLKVQHTAFLRKKKQKRIKHLLSSRALPFRVSAIDVWNGTPNATIQINGQSELIAQHDTQAGWTLTRLSFDPAIAIFKNRHNQRVMVRLA